jgi:hypothetical protein
LLVVVVWLITTQNYGADDVGMLISPNLPSFGVILLVSDQPAILLSTKLYGRKIGN